MSEQAARKRVRIRHFAQAKASGEKITALTSYDVQTARIFDEAGIDVLLVGDSAANVVLGLDTTLPITVDEIITLAKAVVRGASRALVVADLPFGSYERGPEQALDTAVRFMKETGVAAVKLEGGERSADVIRRIVDAGIPVMGHIGFTPQAEHGLGGHVIQGKGETGRAQLLRDALAVQEAGAFAVVLEMVPAKIAAEVSAQLEIPTIGIGAGAGCDGQILVWTDALGLGSGRVPSFVRAFADARAVFLDAATAYRDAVKDGTFPAASESFSDPTAD
ncbi:3-methyl-2-oxobutanoate hydroxymethyltransferase [Pseudoclavibacter chungangensis]|uniref:3-methyl-2-oxobutanoate hydroxymethyltransferase n=1 Tax=Pseudoclavibacter chungangensis TaxID=587635 RepID=A0A7J5BQD6_9MICO|nr:3-methyl-2-oxobutanoate hydroxymethyltransferase [Pseudoclavibacter chungangensis]KAB1655981.1 3-methyl-2-oxobutanoate hydroxymethyltransferase [Pseudoclavibacter chungangensis]NYJ66428.1 3-methyl-2-oxobutanoate hydroxymethyltransferase [Pseudoclavibacter chungangensis]